MKNQLKIIALKPLKGCAPHILKVLKENQPYFLYNNYKESENKQYIEKIEEGLPIDFFSVKSSEHTPNIMISAIVGKNGDGKSSIIELIIRILNNFAHVYNFGRATEDLIYVEGINAELFLSVSSNIKDREDEVIYKIKIVSDIRTKKNSVLLFSSKKTEEPLWCHTDFDIKDNLPIKATNKRLEEFLPLDHCFFTMIINYSSYAYNINEFKEEWGWRDEFHFHTKEHINNNICWIDRLFHKNDGYQTPIVLHPFREKGNVDVNTEAYLTKQRVISLFLNDDNGRTSFRWVNNKQYAESIEYKLEEKSKLDSKTFYNYFKNIYYYNSYSVQGEVPTISQLNNKLNLCTNKDLESDDLRKKIVQEIILINKIRENVKKFIEEEYELVERAIKIKKQLKEDLKNERDNAESLESETDFYTLLLDHDKFEEYLKRLNFIDSKYQVEKKLDNSCRSILSQFNGNQFIRIALVAYHKKIWREKLDRIGVSEDKLKSEIGKRLFDYLIYKSISIVNKYPQYTHSRHIDTFVGFLSNGGLMDLTKKMHKSAIEDMINNKSHITLKVRQALTFLNVDIENKTIYKKDIYDILQSCSKEEKLKIAELTGNGEKIKTTKVNLLNIEKYYKNIKIISSNENKLIEFIPPPIFETDVILKQGEEKSRLSHLSSGERQLIGTVSSIIYHLRNINSVKKEEKDTIAGKLKIYKYKHVNLFFEEVELYFHPEFQRKFIHYLLKSISKIELKEIESINMCFVTHSPFILSDIPKENVLFLEDGKSKRCMVDDTFGANIYDLLNNGFFLKKYSGDFALGKIEELIKEVNSITLDATNLQIEDMEKRIQFVGEPFIRDQLFRSLYTKTGDNNKFRILELEEELKQLKENINDDKNAL